jgi:hypothetical protein
MIIHERIIDLGPGERLIERTDVTEGYYLALAARQEVEDDIRELRGRFEDLRDAARECGAGDLLPRIDDAERAVLREYAVPS